MKKDKTIRDTADTIASTIKAEIEIQKLVLTGKVAREDVNVNVLMRLLEDLMEVLLNVFGRLKEGSIEIKCAKETNKAAEKILGVVKEKMIGFDY